MAAPALRPRWKQPVTGIIPLTAFTVIAWISWYLFSDPRGPEHWFLYPFVLYLAVMILVALWQHALFGDWPFQNLSQPLRGILETAANLVSGWFVIQEVFYKILGTGFNFISQVSPEALASVGKTVMPDGRQRFMGSFLVQNIWGHRTWSNKLRYLLCGQLGAPVPRHSPGSRSHE